MTKNIWIASVLNFFLLGAGTLYVGKRPIVGGLLTVGAILATYVELQLQELDTGLYWTMFVGFFLLAIGCTVDVWNEVKGLEAAAANE